MNLSKLIPLLCVLTLAFPTTADAGRRKNRKSRNAQSQNAQPQIELDNYGFPREAHLTEKNIQFTNWTQYNHEDEEKDMLIQAACLKGNTTSTPLDTVKHDFEIVPGTETNLPATGRDVSWTEGNYEKEDCVGLRLIKMQKGGIVVNLSTKGSFELFSKLRKLPLTVDGYNAIGLDCQKGTYYAFIRYLPAHSHAQPEESTDPNGYYNLFEGCY